MVIPPQYREAHTKGLKRYLATGEGPLLNKRIEITACHRDRHEFPVELTISPLRSGEAGTISAFVRDITERKRAEEACGQRLCGNEKEQGVGRERKSAASTQK